jgi:two-component system sensor histidine kinase KdpD
MVCLTSRPGATRLLRTGARIAGRLATNWYAVYADTPEGKRRHGDEESKTRLEEYKRMARELGAQVITLKGKNTADLLIEFAQKENISHVVFGQSARSRLEILFRGSTINRFLAEMRNTTVQVVPMAREKEPREKGPREKTSRERTGREKQ